MMPSADGSQDVPVRVVGSTVFGRYPKISVEQTFNMLISDNWLVPYAAYKNVLAQDSDNPFPNPINANGKGRCIFHSTTLNKLVASIYNEIYLIDTNLSISSIGTIGTFSGDVFIAQDVQGHIAICDKSSIWIYNIESGSFVKATVDGSAALDFTPGYVSFHNGRFLSVDLKSHQWRLSEIDNNMVIFPNDSQHVGEFETKADIPIAALPFPGKSNLIFIFGSTVTEAWVDLGLSLFPYQKSTAINLDYGCLNSDTIATGKDIICWLAANEKEGPFIVYSTGGDINKISTDGIDFKLSSLKNPKDSHAFMFRQDGHLIYHIVFPSDNVSYIYDFNTDKFFTVTDEYMNYHISKRVAYFNNTYYFVSLNDSNLYEFNTSITNYNYGYNENSQYVVKVIPRVRVCDTFRLKDGSNFISESFTVPTEMGVQEDIPRIDISLSANGGQSFGNYVGMDLNSEGGYINRFAYYGLGMSNEMTIQMRMYSLDRVVVGDGNLSIRQ